MQLGTPHHHGPEEIAEHHTSQAVVVFRWFSHRQVEGHDIVDIPRVAVSFGSRVSRFCVCVCMPQRLTECVALFSGELGAGAMGIPIFMTYDDGV